MLRNTSVPSVLLGTFSRGHLSPKPLLRELVKISPYVSSRGKQTACDMHTCIRECTVTQWRGTLYVEILKNLKIKRYLKM